MMRARSEAGFAGWLNRAAARCTILYRLKIGPRLTLCFAVVIALMLVGNGILFFQFHLVRGQVERLTGVNEELIEVLRIDTGLLSAYERLDVAARSEDSGRLLHESEALRTMVLEDAQRTQATFEHLPAELKVDETVLPTLESIERTIPSYLDAIKALAVSGEWEAVRRRLANNVQPMESLSSRMVESVAHDVGEQRVQATLNIARAEKRAFVAVVATALVSLLIATGLAIVITRSITDPLSRLIEASQALARGEFQHQVRVSGQDELATLGQVFNTTASRLRLLYETLSKSEANLAEAQRLSHSGSWSWNLKDGRSFWSAETYHIFGFDQESEAPTRESLLQRVRADDRTSIEAVEDGLNRGVAAEHDYRILLPDKSERFIHEVARAITDESGQVIEFVGSVTDVTEQRNSRRALEVAFEEIKALKDQLYKENIALREDIDKVSMFEDIVGSSEPLRRVLVQVAKVAATDSTVLILGETGTGKELVARAIHRRSTRANKPFIRVNCAAIPPTLVASELFGHEKGAFTGATQRRLGRFELADGGTIFLDEIGELPGETQSAVLRVLQEREFERVGSSHSVSVDVRVLSATNRDLKAAVAAGTFREDLFYRLNVFPIQVPSLRERVDDIPLLLSYLIDRYAKKAGKKFRSVDRKTLALFSDYKWPGNIRELQNVVERAVVLCEGDTFAIDETWLKTDLPRPGASSRRLARLDEGQERQLIEAALVETEGRVSGPAGAAALLGLPRQTLESRIAALGINKHKFKSVQNR